MSYTYATYHAAHDLMYVLNTPEPVRKIFKQGNGKKEALITLA